MSEGAWRWNEEEQKFEPTMSAAQFRYQMRRSLTPEVRALLDAASEVYGKLGPADVTPLARKHYGTFERLRSALLGMEREGYVAEDWPISRTSEN